MSSERFKGQVPPKADRAGKRIQNIDWSLWERRDEPEDIQPGLGFLILLGPALVGSPSGPPLSALLEWIASSEFPDDDPGGDLELPDELHPLLDVAFLPFSDGPLSLAVLFERPESWPVGEGFIFLPANQEFGATAVYKADDGKIYSIWETEVEITASIRRARRLSDLEWAPYVGLLEQPFHELDQKMRELALEAGMTSPVLVVLVKKPEDPILERRMPPNCWLVAVESPEDLAFLRRVSSRAPWVVHPVANAADRTGLTIKTLRRP